MICFNSSINKAICLLFFTFVSAQGNASCPAAANDPSIAIAEEISFEDDARYDGFILGSGGCLYDPKLYTIDDVEPVFPSEGVLNNTIAGVFVNGMGNTAYSQLKNLRILADALGRPMVGVHNAARAGYGELTEMAPFSAPAKSISDAILLRVNAEQRIRIWGSSQGTFYVSRGVTLANKHIASRPFNHPKKKLDLIEVVTTGGAAPFWTDGPRYVHYVNKQDKIPQLIGPASLFSKPGRGAVFATFDYRNDDPTDGCADDDWSSSKDQTVGLLSEAIGKVMGAVLEQETHVVCVYSSNFEDFDALRGFAKKFRPVRVNVPFAH